MGSKPLRFVKKNSFVAFRISEGTPCPVVMYEMGMSVLSSALISPPNAETSSVFVIMSDEYGKTLYASIVFSILIGLKR